MGVFYKDPSRVACRESHYQTSAVVQGGGKPNLNVGRGLGRRRKEREKQEKTKDDCQNLNLSGGRIILF